MLARELPAGDLRAVRRDDFLRGQRTGYNFLHVVKARHPRGRGPERKSPGERRRVSPKARPVPGPVKHPVPQVGPIDDLIEATLQRTGARAERGRRRRPRRPRRRAREAPRLRRPGARRAPDRAAQEGRGRAARQEGREARRPEPPGPDDDLRLLRPRHGGERPAGAGPRPTPSSWPSRPWAAGRSRSRAIPRRPGSSSTTATSCSTSSTTRRAASTASRGCGETLRTPRRRSARQREARGSRMAGRAASSSALFATRHRGLREQLRRLARALDSANTVLLLGAPGTGKDRLARLLHERSARARRAVRARRPRGRLGRPLRERALRARARGVHGRRRGKARPPRGRGRGHALPRPGRRAFASGPGQAPPRRRGAPRAARRRARASCRSRRASWRRPVPTCRAARAPGRSGRISSTGSRSSR